ncbi:ABC transporter permease [Anaeromicropila herbilytica]|uniref:MacB-like periplasmic core domain-containing protein n=1 Tax=Anaeromicropila herbilytica TaxID=2785025 RepID=A0A7R7EK04_9FIRM|nr:ABC transporter permease [Anaeromicropila herbilytica]BCN30210.1 hypothetical protein bsdtb5_15050 [Anaeromicropila herbilytica]
MRKKRTAYKVVGLFLFFTLIALSMCLANYVKDNLSSVSLRYEKASVSSKIIEKALSNLENSEVSEKPEITLWNRLKNEIIKNKITDITVKTNVIEVNGSMSEVVPMTFLSGAFASMKDDKGCVMDSKTAFDLYGTINAVNNVVIWKGKEYIVRGVVKAKDTMMLLPIEDDDYLYQNVEAIYQNNVKNNLADNEGEIFKNLLIDQGAPEPDAMIDGEITSWFLQWFYKLPILILTVLIIVMYIKITYQNRKSLFICISYGLFTIVIGFIIYRIFPITIHVPSQFIPTKWSDFQFYINKQKEIQDSIINKNNCERMPRDILLTGYRFKCILCVLANLLLLGLAAWMSRFKKKVTTIL